MAIYYSENNYLFIILIVCLSCKSQDVNKLNKNNSFSDLSIEEIQEILQEGIETNQLDTYFSEEEKEKGMTIVINDFIKPYLGKLKLNKFNQEVIFKTHQQIYSDLNEKFIDINLGYLEGDTLMVNFSIRGRFNAMFVKYNKQNEKWIKITKNVNTLSDNLATVNFTDNKENCLAHSILKKKYPGKYNYLSTCKGYNFDVNN